MCRVNLSGRAISSSRTMWSVGVGVQPVVVRPIPQISRNVLFNAFTYLQDNLVTSHVIYATQKLRSRL